MAKQPTTQITLRDPETNKSADLGDEQGVRNLLTAVLNRLGPNAVWKHRFPKDPTERVAVQILRKTDGLPPALELIKNAPSLHAILEGTDLAEDIAGVAKPKASEKGVGLIGEKGFERLAEDVILAFERLWPTFRESIEKSEGEEKKSASVKIEFVPKTDAADAYTKVVASHQVSTSEITRTSTVRKLTSGRHQLELFESSKL